MAKLLVVALSLLALSVSAAVAQPPTLRIPRVDDPPVLSRYLDGTTVPPGVRVGSFVQREPGDGVPSIVETNAYVSYDAAHLNVVFICKDNPALVRANLTKREAIMGDDIVAVTLDTYHDGRRAYMFLVNPLGIQMDGVTTVGQDDDYSYDTLWQSDGRVTSFGYVVVVRIPFKSLRFSNASEQTWGLALGRIVPRANETSFWPYITRRIANFGDQLAAAEGLTGISPGRNLLAIPYGNFAAARVTNEAGERVSDQSARVGIDGKAVIKDAVTLDTTINPDFSQVESDEPQVTINQRYEVFFPEKRPFFIENAGMFETPENLFFSRRIADPKIGARVTGRSAGWAYAGLAINDDAPGRFADSGDTRAGKTAAIAVLRVQREFEGQSHIGGIVTDREWGSGMNRVAGVDGRWKIDDNWSVEGQAVGTRTQDPGSDVRAGSALTAEVSRDGRGFNYSSSYLQRSPDYWSDVGFVPRVDMKEMQHEAGYSWHPKNSRVLRIGTDVELGTVWSYANDLQDWSVEPGIEIEFPGQTQLGVRYWEYFERFDGVDFRRRSSMAYASTEWLSWLNLNANVRWGTSINYYPAAGMEAFLGDALTVESGFTLKPSSRLRIDQAYIYSGLSTRDDTPLPAGVAAGRIFANHIFRTRATYQFTRPLSVRAILDYDTVTPNAALVDLDRDRRFNADILFTYMVNPWTAIYMGYTDAYANRAYASPLQRPMAISEAPLESVGRQVFLKVSYLLRVLTRPGIRDSGFGTRAVLLTTLYLLLTTVLRASAASPDP